jgi:hypothetical protein
VVCFAQTTEPNQTEDARGIGGGISMNSNARGFTGPDTRGVLIALLIVIVVFAAGMGGHFLE